MLSDLECANLLQSQYNGDNIFDYQIRIGVVSIAVKYSPDCTIIAFEGSYNIPDWLSNLQVSMITTPLGRVEEGFYTDLPEVYADLKPVLKDKPIQCIGHSRGAAHANLFGLILIKDGFNNISRIKFGEPHSMDAETARDFAGSHGVSYWNYRDALQHDPVGSVPFYIPALAPYVPSENRTLIDVAPMPDDTWGPLARHHIYYYIQGLTKGVT